MNIYFVSSLFYLLVVCGVYGFAYLFDLSTLQEVSYLSRAADNAGTLFFTLSALFSLGAYCGGLLIKSSRLTKASKVREGIFNTNFFNENKVETLGKICSAVNIALVLLVFIIGGSAMLSRQYYHLDFGSESADLFFSNIEVLSAFLPVVSRFFWSGTRGSRFIGNLSILFTVFYLYSIGTKLCAISLLLYFLVSFYKDRKVSALQIALLPLVPILFVFVIFQRILGEYGLLSVFTLIQNLGYLGVEAGTLALDVVISPIFITAVTFGLKDASLSMFLIEVNPLPGYLIGWYDVADSERINPAIPFNALGGLAAYSYALVVWYGVVSSVAISLFELGMRLIIGRYATVAALALSFLHIGLIYQYNFRSSFRWIYFCLFVYGALFVMSKFIVKPKSHAF